MTFVRRALDWLTDPTKPGRKRGIAAGALLLGGALRGIGAALKEACAAALFLTDSAWCSVDPAAWAGWVEMANVVIQQLAAGADLAAIAFAIVGLFHARQKARAKPPLSAIGGYWH